jgi:hypothetical protein
LDPVCVIVRGHMQTRHLPDHRFGVALAAYVLASDVAYAFLFQLLQ